MARTQIALELLGFPVPAHGRSIGGRMPAMDRQRHPSFTTAVLADARVTAAFRGERHLYRSRIDAVLQILRLAFVSDAFLGQALYRAKSALQARGVPILPRILQRLAIASAAIYVGDDVVVRPGMYVVHGQVVIDGDVEIGRDAVLFPAVTVSAGPGESIAIGSGASLGTGSRVLGSVDVGERAQIGAGAVVLEDVPAGATVTGVPATGGGPASSRADR
jgi:serine O-acetyltransferase